MEKLFLPQGCMFEGSISSIKYGGDIELQTHLEVPKITSGQGGIKLEMSEATYSSTALSAPEGSIDVEASSLELKSLEAQEANLKVANAAKLALAEVNGTFAITAEQLDAQHLTMGQGKFDVQQLNLPKLEVSGALELHHDQGIYKLEQVQAKSLSLRGLSAEFEALQIAGEAVIELSGSDEKIHFNSIKAGQLTFNGSAEIDAGILEIEGDATLTFTKGKFKEIRARNLKISGGLECERLVVTEKVEVSSGFVNIRQLECPEFHAEPDVMGIVMVANTDKVVAQGVRGFLRPDEVSFLSSNVSDAAGEPSPSEEAAVEEQVAEETTEAQVAETEPDAETYETQHFETPTVEFPEADLAAAAASEAEAPTEAESEPDTFVPADVDADEAEISDVSAEVDQVDEVESDEAAEDQEAETFEAVSEANLPEPEPETDGDAFGEVTETDVASNDDWSHDAETASETEVSDDWSHDTETTSETEVASSSDWSHDADTATDIENPFASQADLESEMVAADPFEDASESETDAEDIDDVETFDDTDPDVEIEAFPVDELTVDDIDDSGEADDTDPDAFAADEVTSEAIEGVGDNTFDSVSDSLDDSDAIESFDADAIDDSGHFEVDAADLEDFDDEDLSVDASELEDLPAVEGFDIQEPSGDIQESDLQADVDITGSDLEELSADDLYASDDLVSDDDAEVASTETASSGGPAATAEVVDFSEEEMAKFLSGEMSLQEQLDRILVQIKNLFPDDNYPKFIDQVQNYVAEERFNILIKTRNKEAVMGSFNKLDHPEINRLAKAFYDTLEAGYQA